MDWSENCGGVLLKSAICFRQNRVGQPCLMLARCKSFVSARMACLGGLIPLASDICHLVTNWQTAFKRKTLERGCP